MAGAAKASLVSVDASKVELGRDLDLVSRGWPKGLSAAMVKKIKTRTYEDAVSWFRNHEFDVLEAPGTSNRVFLKKYHVSAAIERTDDGGVKIFAYPGYLINGEISKLVDHGYQKVLKTTKSEYPATADHLKSLHQFAEELKGGTGAISLYNEALGTVSESYMYDRVRDRDLPESERPERPWQEPEPATKRPA
jgi:hypothetical protein